MSMRFWQNPFHIAVLVYALFCILLLCAHACDARAAEYPAPELTQSLVENPPAAKENRPAPAEPEPVVRALFPYHVVLAKTVWGEAVGCSKTERAAVIWCVLNRVDAGYGDIITCATAPGAFVGYRESNPVDPDILELVYDVLDRWWLETTNSGEVGRVLPADFLWFHGDGTHNYFRNAYSGGDVWDWSLPTPYEEDAA